MDCSDQWYQNRFSSGSWSVSVVASVRKGQVWQMSCTHRNEQAMNQLAITSQSVLSGGLDCLRNTAMLHVVLITKMFYRWGASEVVVHHAMNTGAVSITTSGDLFDKWKLKHVCWNEHINQTSSLEEGDVTVSVNTKLCKSMTLCECLNVWSSVCEIYVKVAFETDETVKKNAIYYDKT